MLVPAASQLLILPLKNLYQVNLAQEFFFLIMLYVILSLYFQCKCYEILSTSTTLFPV